MLESLLGRELVDVEQRSIHTESLNDPDSLVEALSKEYGTGLGGG